MCYPIKQL